MKGMNIMKKRYYLAYGSNLNMSQMEKRCPTSRIFGTATLNGYELLFKGSKTGAYLTIEKKHGGQVPVAVWILSPADETNLDWYEGFPDYYYKKDIKVTVKTMSGKTLKVDAFAYIMHENRKLGEPSRHYVRSCQEGYEKFGFDKRLLDEAYERSVSHER